MSQLPASFTFPTKILLPVDFSPSSYAASEMAEDLAQHYHAELSFLHVIPRFPVDPDANFFAEAEVDREAKSDTERQLAACVADAVAKGLKASSTVEIGNDVVGNIMSVIERDHIDMIVLSTHGMSGWRPMVLGSIAEKVVKLVQCPLLLLRSLKPVAA